MRRPRRLEANELQNLSAQLPDQRVLASQAHELVTDKGFEALRIEEVVAGAGVAKGTVLAHFKDKDALMNLLIGERFNALLDQMAARSATRDVEQLAKRLVPLVNLMASERYVFDVTPRRSGVEAFLVQTLALNSCALHSDKRMKDRLLPCLRAWLAPVGG